MYRPWNMPCRNTMECMKLYEVAVAAPLANTLTYAQPKDSSEVVETGRCVVVPLGRRKVTGYVLGSAEPPSRESQYAIKSIHSLLDDRSYFPEKLVPLYRWISRYYHHPIGEVIKTALPVAPGARSGRKVILVCTDHKMVTACVTDKAHPDPAWLAPLLQDRELSPSTVRGLWSSPRDQRLLKKLEQQGCIEIRAVLTGRSVGEKKIPIIVPGELTRDYLAEEGKGGDGLIDLVESALARSLRKSEKKALALFVELHLQNNRQPVIRKQLQQMYKNCLGALRSLHEAAVVLLKEQRMYRDPFGEVPAYFPPPEFLTPEQKQVLAEIQPSIINKTFSRFLLFGITGCGKTEVYLQTVQRTLELGRTALVLVPEIALASQLEAHFYSRFGNKLAVLHSGLTAGERFDQWQNILNGRARVVIGARSAVFAPLESLGLVIVDEEHEPAYKQEDGFRYHGRDLAVLRAKFDDCPVILGSATPSVISYHHARQGKYTLLTMAKRVEERELPLVEIVDLTSKKKSRPDLFFSDRLTSALAENIDKGQQSLLFVNRRGFASFMLCRDCGHVLQCQHCHVSLTLHKGRQLLMCHYCGFSLRPDSTCPSCRSLRVAGFGLGSERIEAETRQLFPEARIARLDSDTAVNRKQYLAILKSVREGKVDILIGTQMIAKGLHFPGITLVGVVWADSGLSMPDYKAAERTFSLLSQVTGRAGRGEQSGRVVIQTHQPEHYAVQFAKGHDYPGLYEKEVAQRSMLAYPPFSRLVNIRFSSKDEERVKAVAEKVNGFLRQCNLNNDVIILGPAPSPLARLRDRCRWQLLLKSDDVAKLHRMCDLLVAEKSRLCGTGVRLGIDIDPENML